MERLIGMHCYLCHVATTNTRTLGKGRIRNGWIFFVSEVTRKDFSIAIQGCFGGTKVDSTLLDNVLIPYHWSEYLYHVGCFLFLHSVTHSRLIAGGKNATEGTQTVFLTALNPMSDAQEEEHQDVSKPRMVHNKSKWKAIQDATYWINLRKAQDKGLKIDQTKGVFLREKDDVPSPEVVQADPLLHNHLTRKEGGHSTQKPNSKPKPHQNKNHVHNGHVRPTEGWQLTVVEGSVSQIHTGKKEERHAKPVARSLYQIRKVQDTVKNCLHQTNRVFPAGKRRHAKFCRYRERDSFSRRIQSSQCHCVNQGQTIGVSQTISSNKVTLSCLSYRISTGSSGARVVSGSIVLPGASWCEH